MASINSVTSAPATTYTDSLQCYLSTESNPRAGFFTMARNIDEALYEQVVVGLNEHQAHLVVKDIKTSAGNDSLSITSHKGVLLGFINGKTVPECRTALLSNTLHFSSAKPVSDISDIF